jgi:DNA-directed RNA polymerase specialized sigma24 family protein
MTHVHSPGRVAIDQLYMRYFAQLAKFFQNMNVCAHLVEELINDTMFEVWKEGASIGANASVRVAIMRLAYSRVQKHFAEAKIDTPTNPPPSLQVILSKLPLEERALMHLVYASGCSRRETADIMRITCHCVDVLLRGARASAKQHFSVTSAHAQVNP